MDEMTAWDQLREAISFAEDKLTNDRFPMNERERADANLYLLRIMTACLDASMLTMDPSNPSFLPMLEAVRYVGAAGPDIDYDVAMIAPNIPYRIEGTRGGATFVGIAVYAHDERAATAIVDAVDVDTIVRADGTFAFDFEHPAAARVIVRQYFHDRATQPRGTFAISRTDGGGGATSQHLPSTVEIAARAANAANSIRWNAELNDLWTPERRDTPNVFIHQSPDEIVAAITNPDVNYSFTYWQLDDDQVLAVTFTPPATRYWSLQICDRFFQCFPNRKTSINDHEATPNADGTYTIYLSDDDPSQPNWLDLAGLRHGTAIFRWLHATPDAQPVAEVLPRSALD